MLKNKGDKKASDSNFEYAEGGISESESSEIRPLLDDGESDFKNIMKTMENNKNMKMISTSKSSSSSTSTSSWNAPITKTATTVINFNQNSNNNNNNNNNINKDSNKTTNNNNNSNNSDRNTKLNSTTVSSTKLPAKTTNVTTSIFRTKYLTWSYRILRRKQIIGLIAAAFLYLLYMTSMGADDAEGQEQIPVVHYSHVPGMKDANSTMSQEQQQQPKNLTRELQIKNFTKSIKSAKNVAIMAAALELDTASAITKKNAAALDIYTADAIIDDDISNNNNSNNNNITSYSLNPSKSNFLISNQINNTGNIVNISYNATNETEILLPPTGYLVWSERCKMPNLDPYLPETMKYFNREKYKPCSVQNPLTTVAYSEASQRYVLRIIDDVIPSYSKSGAIDCCYQVIERNSTGGDADKNISLSECISFKKSTKLAPHIDNILVKCRAKKKQVYINGHAMMPERTELRERLEAWRRNDTQQKRHRPPSVLMIGIDSISRINLIRAMPKTAQYLYDNEWFEMSGYNKIDDNTFPNLMAVLAGLNKTNAYLKCPPTTINGLDNCNFIWRTFRDHGYVTAYAEDEASINTFNYLKMGFERPPADYYLRPFLIGAEKHLRVKHKSGLNFCLGYQHSADFVYEYAIELARRFKHEPYFGLFWTNSFSHNAISDCTAMDEKMVEYLKRFSSLGAFDNSIVIFFSDHGMRFGPTRNSYSGHLEERLPFLFIWLPQQIKQTHPEFVNALSVNKNRLTNPYDLHMTLKHILKMSGRVQDKKQLQQAEDCLRCQTLLEPVLHNRSCDDVAIEDHWCTCIPYQSVYKNSKMVQNLAKAAVTYINEYVANYKNGSYAQFCVPLHLLNVESAYRAQPGAIGSVGNITNDTNAMETYRLIFQTKPNKAIFEATIRFANSAKLLNNPKIEVTGEISRLNSYSTDSECVGDGGAKKYCSCRKKKLF